MWFFLGHAQLLHSSHALRAHPSGRLPSPSLTEPSAFIKTIYLQSKHPQLVKIFIVSLVPTTTNSALTQRLPRPKTPSRRVPQVYIMTEEFKAFKGHHGVERLTPVIPNQNDILTFDSRRLHCGRAQSLAKSRDLYSERTHR